MIKDNTLIKGYYDDYVNSGHFPFGIPHCLLIALSNSIDTKVKNNRFKIFIGKYGIHLAQKLTHLSLVSPRAIRTKKHVLLTQKGCAMYMLSS